MASSSRWRSGRGKRGLIPIDILYGKERIAKVSNKTTFHIASVTMDDPIEHATKLNPPHSRASGNCKRTGTTEKVRSPVGFLLHRNETSLDNWKIQEGGSQRVHGSLTDSALEIQTAAPNHQELPGSERRGEALLHPFRSTPTNATFLRMSDFTAVRMG